MIYSTRRSGHLIPKTPMDAEGPRGPERAVREPPLRGLALSCALQNRGNPVRLNPGA